jgi:tRNA(Ile)-lysidine synthase
MDELARRARHWGAFGEVRLDASTLAADEADTALRLLADTLGRISGAIYRPRFRALSDVLDGILSGADSGSTLSGCLIRPEAGTALICREPGTCDGRRPLAAGPVDWDRRWTITARGGWPAEAHVGPLGEPGLAALRTGGTGWTVPEPWASAPRVVRQTTPAIWRGTGTAPADLLAAPLADYRNQQTIAPECVIFAGNIATRALP